ncbi:response regulator transcription factor [Paraburkholderia sp. DHOC27]|uniref:response regulator transcription factor n=1 Tax=Paraburkholderia sp. DHOC27 TaxID=2303330 RepID=UPI000E3B942D|nr:response regulator transcription factor [Paraburkholderia sp. DHOC27]RFU49710.1 DNA-binding response regulator [Paraburkholderia sp. DHOC27]
MRVLIVDDHELFRAGLELLLKERFQELDVLFAGTLAEGLHLALAEPLNIVILDLALPDGHGCIALEQLKELRPSLPVIVVSADERVDTIRRCIELRAVGYVPKSSPPESLRVAIGATLAGGVFLPAWSIPALQGQPGPEPVIPPSPIPAPLSDQTHDQTHVSDAASLGLTAREFETLTLLVRGLPSKAIAVKMRLEDITVRKYISHLLEHFRVRRRTELIVLLADQGIKLGPPPLTEPAQDRTLSGAPAKESD